MERNKIKLASKGVVIFALLIITSTLSHMSKLIFDQQIYMDYYQYMPTWMMVLRYSFSWAQRVLGLLVGIGLLVRNDWARKVGLVIGFFTIATVYWKHPYDAFKIHTAYLDAQLAGILAQWGLSPIDFSSLTVPSIIIHCVLDILFWAGYIYFFTRPSVKQQFRLKA